MAFSIRSGLAWLGFAQAMVFASGFASSIVVARLLSPYEMGIYAGAAAIVGLLEMLRAFGLNGYIVREASLSTADIQAVFTINSLLAVLISLLVLGVAEIGGVLVGEPGIRDALRVLAVVPLLRAVEFLPTAQMEREGAFRILGLITLARSVSNNAVTVALALNGWSFMSIAWGTVTSTLMGGILTTVVGRRFISLRPGMTNYRRVLDFGLKTVTINAVAGVAQRLSELFLGQIAGLAALGLFSRASGLNNLIWDNIHAVIARVVVVDFAQQRRTTGDFRHSYLRVTAIVTGFLWPCFAGIGLLSGPIVLNIYGPNWAGSALPLSVLSIASVIATAATMTSEVYLVCGEQRRQLRFESLRTAITMPMFLVACLGGVVWAAIARVGEAILFLNLSRADISRLTQTTAKDCRPIYWSSAVLTLAACSPAAVIMMSYGWVATVPLIPIGASIALGILLWTVAILITRHPLRTEILLVFRLFQRAVSIGRVG